MKRRKPMFVFLLILGILLTGCVRTEEFNQRITEDLSREVSEVQSAVDLYRKENNNVLPLKSPQGPNLYQKYILDFTKLDAYLSGIPSNSFQKGGHFVFVAVDPGTDPQVRVMDLRVTEKLREMQGRVNAYKEKKGELPKGERVGDGIYTLDFKALNTDPVTIPSPYHSQLSLPLVIDSQGVVHVDYRMDVMQIMEESDKKPAAGQDLRELLHRDSLFVPAHSLPMQLEDGDPMLKKE